MTDYLLYYILFYVFRKPNKCTKKKKKKKKEKHIYEEIKAAAEKGILTYTA